MNNHPKIIALLPMKANSERVRGKNFKQLHGKPLFRWILDSLLNVEKISKVIINTDARSILEENGLNDSDTICIRDRKDELCGDYVSMNLIIEDDIKNNPSDIYVMTHTTNPLLSSSTIENALNQFIRLNESGMADSLFSVTRYQTRFYQGDATPVNHDPSQLIRTQDLEPWYEENSNLYIFTGKSFKEANSRIGNLPFMFQTPKIESVDIDEPEDWLIAESLAKGLYP
jgi:CMP-N-acetylneuraminic acid synthetase